MSKGNTAAIGVVVAFAVGTLAGNAMPRPTAAILHTASSHPSIRNHKSTIINLPKGRTLDYADIQHYQKIVVALSETIRIMGAIDQTIEAQGGWSGVFVSQHCGNSEIVYA